MKKTSMLILIIFCLQSTNAFSKYYSGFENQGDADGLLIRNAEERKRKEGLAAIESAKALEALSIRTRNARLDIERRAILFYAKHAQEIQKKAKEDFNNDERFLATENILQNHLNDKIALTGISINQYADIDSRKADITLQKVESKISQGLLGEYIKSVNAHQDIVLNSFKNK